MMNIKHNNKLFISHASEDKYFVRPLVEELQKQGVDVWYDEISLKVGDSLRQKIEEALVFCPYGLVVISKNFFSKEWPQRELDGLTHNEISSKRKVILPIWLDITAEEVFLYSPSLADKIGLRSDDGIPSIVSSVLEVITVADDRTVFISPRQTSRANAEDIIQSYVSTELLSGTTLNSRYTLKSILGKGGLTINYVAWDDLRESEVVIKEFFPSELCARDEAGNVIPSKQADEITIDLLKKETIQAIKAELKISEKAKGILIDTFRENATIYSIYERLNGKVLRDILKEEGTLSVSEVVELFSDILITLNEVHLMGIIHRDIKPSNIMITNQGRAIILDWGISGNFEDSAKSEFVAVLTPGYAPPEQYTLKAKLTPAVDIYAIGATLYEILTGIKPQESIFRVADDKLVPITELVNINKSVADAIMRALSLKSERRQGTTLELLSQLQRDPISDHNPQASSNDLSSLKLMIKKLRKPFSRRTIL